LHNNAGEGSALEASVGIVVARAGAAYRCSVGAARACEEALVSAISMSPGRVALHGRAATQVANSAAPGRAPRPATAPVSRSWTAAAVPGLHTLAVRALLDFAIAAGSAGEVMSGACAAAAGLYAHQGVTAKPS
jgi:hypothetical protein